MTPNEHLEILRQKYLKEIDEFFTENNIILINFQPVENNIDIDPYSLDNQGILTLIDEFGNDFDEKINTLSIEAIAHILTLIETKKYDIE